MSIKTLSSSFILLIALLLTACGYHLRGDIDLPNELKAVYLENASDPLREQFQLALDQSTVRLVKNRSEATAIITISNEDILKRSLSLGSAGYSNQVGLEYRLNYDVTDVNNKPLVNSLPIEIRREYFNTQTLVLGKDNEEQVVLKEMYQQAVRNIINQVRFSLKNKSQ